ncbi:hypothetical protein HYV64_02360 [Candidatus Shapirobacteria bacterium]|nr:hypothetical protein [Candidatus Shapirobacteria bacterium]
MPANAKIICDRKTCKATIHPNSSEDPLLYYAKIDFAPEGDGIDKSEENVNPQRITWRSVMWMDEDYGHFEIQPGDFDVFEWTTGKSGLYRMTIWAFAEHKETVVTEVYAYFDALPRTAPETNQRSLTCYDNSIVMHTDTNTREAKGSLLYVNDARWMLFDDQVGYSNEMAIPMPVITIESPYINVASQKWDNYYEFDRDEHTDHENAVFCATPYQ